MIGLLRCQNYLQQLFIMDPGSEAGMTGLRGPLMKEDLSNNCMDFPIKPRLIHHQSFFTQVLAWYRHRLHKTQISTTARISAPANPQNSDIVISRI